MYVMHQIDLIHNHYGHIPLHFVGLTDYFIFHMVLCIHSICLSNFNNITLIMIMIIFK